MLRWTCARQSWHHENSPGVQVSAADVLRHKASFKGGQSWKQREHEKSKGMVLPFRQLNVAFSHMYYSVDLPSVSTLLQLTQLLLHDMGICKMAEATVTVENFTIYRNLARQEVPWPRSVNCRHLTRPSLLKEHGHVCQQAVSGLFGAVSCSCFCRTSVQCTDSFGLLPSNPCV